jgi:general secretion pathway protein G
MPRRRLAVSRRRRGFTLMEVMLVLVILVILGSLTVGMFSSQQKQAAIRSTRAQIGLFKSPLDTYHLDMGAYPSTDEGLAALSQAPSSAANAANWAGPYLEGTVPTDPWGNAYQYQYPGTKNTDRYDIWSFGPDRSNGTDDDIYLN